jgi:membrane protease YdiL (CAAX protease family)
MKIIPPQKNPVIRKIPRPFTHGLREAFMPDRLLPRKNAVSNSRMQALLALSCLWLILLRMSVIGPQENINNCLLYAIVAAMYLSIGIFLFGWKRLNHDLFRGNPSTVTWHILGTLFIVHLGAWAIVRIMTGPPPLDIQTVQQSPDRILITARFLSVGLLAPIAEEFAMRFVFFRCLRNRMSFLSAAFISSAVFGLLHLRLDATSSMTMWAGVLSYTYAGVIFSWCYERTATILTPLIVHMAFNMLTVG